jgi:hypothetical protein
LTTSTSLLNLYIVNIDWEEPMTIRILCLITLLSASIAPTTASAQALGQRPTAVSEDELELALADSHPAELSDAERLHHSRRILGATGGRAALGGVLLGTGLAMIPTMTEYRILSGTDDIAFFGATMPILISLGTPMLVASFAELKRAEHIPLEQRGLYIRARVGQTFAAPYAVAGSLLGTIGLVAAIDLGGEGYPSAPAMFAGAIGYSLAGAGGVLAHDGDRAAQQLGDKVPRKGFLAFGIPMVAVGGVATFAAAPLVRAFQSDSGQKPQAIVGLIGAGSTQMAIGTATLIAGAVQNSKPLVLSERARPRPQILAASPTLDPIKGTVGAAITGRF